MSYKAILNIDNLQKVFDDIDLRLNSLENKPVEAPSPLFCQTIPYGLSELKFLCGNPDDFIINNTFSLVGWENAHLTTVDIPFEMQLSWSTAKVGNITCNRHIDDIVTDLFKYIYNHDINKKILNYGGCYNFRTKTTNRNELSVHAWGMAIDINVGFEQDDILIRIFERFGFIWGGTFDTPDTMHFQYCGGY